MRPTLPFALLVAAIPAAAVAAGPMSEEALAGHQVLSANCGVCHAIETEGDSRNTEAPTFREVVTRYPPESLEEALAEGIVTGHPAMPQFVFEPNEIGAIIAYLDWLGTQ